MAGLVLNEEQKAEIEKMGKAIKNRKYLEEIGLYEIGKLLFYRPAGHGQDIHRQSSLQTVLPAHSGGAAFHDHQPVSG